MALDYSRMKKKIIKLTFNIDGTKGQKYIDKRIGLISEVFAKYYDNKEVIKLVFKIITNK